MNQEKIVPYPNDVAVAHVHRQTERDVRNTYVIKM